MEKRKLVCPNIKCRLAVEAPLQAGHVITCPECGTGGNIREHDGQLVWEIRDPVQTMLTHKDQQYIVFYFVQQKIAEITGPLDGGPVKKLLAFSAANQAEAVDVAKKWLQNNIK